MTAQLSWEAVRFDAQGLVPVIAQEATTGEVLMLAWANRDALDRTLKTGRVHYYSRSRGELWEKGATSGHAQELADLRLDCDGDAILALVHQEGPACHEGTASCFARMGESVPRPTLAALAATIRSRRGASPEKSYTAKLLADPQRASKKIGEEATELVMALASESGARVAEEAADVIYHLLVACERREVSLKQILEVLERRMK